MIWHEGVSGTTQKFVLRDGSFDGAPYFQLGNSQGAAVFYLLDCKFSKRMKDAAISGGTKYFYNCHIDSLADYSWYKDNLSSAPGSPAAAIPSAKWTFDNLWDPENTMPAVMPFASIPQPRHKAYSVASSGTSLKWTAARNGNSYNIYLGKTSSPPMLTNLTTTNYMTGKLDANTTYYWRVDAVTDAGVIPGKIWQFKTDAATGVSETGSRQPMGFSLDLNYPNPFNPTTTIGYRIAKAGPASLKIYDVMGRVVATLVDDVKAAGSYTVQFDGKDLPSGVYAYELRAGSFTSVNKMTLIK